SRRQEIDELTSGVVAQPEDFLDRLLLKFIPLDDALIAQALGVAKFDAEDVVHQPAYRRHSTAGERNLPRLRMPGEPVVPFVLLLRRELEQHVESQGTPVDGAHTRRSSARQFRIARLMSARVCSSPAMTLCASSSTSSSGANRSAMSWLVVRLAALSLTTGGSSRSNRRRSSRRMTRS